MMLRGARSVGAQAGNSRLGSSSSNALDQTWDVIQRAATENEVRLISLVREYSAGHEHAHLLDSIFELLYQETSANVMDADACRSALHWAVLHGQAQLVRALLEAGALTNTFAKDGTTPLMVAVRKGSIELVELLLEEGARVDLMNTTTGMCPLLLACVFANTEMVQLLLDRKAAPDIQWNGPNGPVTPLIAAAAKVCEPKPMAEQYLQVVETLLEAGACPDIVVNQEKGETLLHNAVIRNQPGLVRTLLRAQANADLPAKDGVTPLMTAVRLSSCELVEALIDGGATVEVKNEFNGKTAFSLACNLGNVELVQLLLAKGASVGSRWFNPNDYNAPILVVASKCDDTLGRGFSFHRWTSMGTSNPCSSANSGTPFPQLSPYGTCGSGGGAGGGATVGSWLIQSGSGGVGGSGLMSARAQVYLDIARVLLQAGADPNTQGSKNGVTPLLIAVENCHAGLLRLLLEAKANLDLPDTSGCTPLISACTEGNVEMARMLLENGAKANLQRRDGWTALMAAVLHRSTVLVEMLLGAGAQHNLLVPPGELLAMESTPLMAACGEGSVEIARILLAQGADPNQANSAGQTALWCACRGGRTEAVQLLLDAGAKLSPPGQQSAPSPLVQAAYSGNCRCVEMMLEAGAQLEEQDTSTLSESRLVGGRFTPLAAACSRGCRAAAELLLRRGADVNVSWMVDEPAGKVELRPLVAALLHPWGRNDEAGDRECAGLVELLLGHGASLSAAEPAHGHTALEIAAREGRAGALQLLLKHGAQSNLVDKDGATPLILAALKGSVACVKLLLEAGANANAATEVGVSPLVAAIGAFATGDGNMELIQALLDAGADPNAPFFEEDTILTAAVDGGNAALVATLLTAGADPGQANAAGALPLQLAVSKGHPELVRLLLQAGASPHLPNLDWASLRYHQKGRHDILELLARAGIVVPPPPPAEPTARGGRSCSSSGHNSASGRRLHARASVGDAGGMRRRSSQGGLGGLGGSPTAGGTGAGEAASRRRSSQSGATLGGSASSGGGAGRLSASGGGSAGRLSASGGGSLGGRVVVSSNSAGARMIGSGSASGLGGGGSGQEGGFGAASQVFGNGSPGSGSGNGGSRSLRPPPLLIGRTVSSGNLDDAVGGYGSGGESGSMSESASGSVSGAGSGPPTASVLRSPVVGTLATAQLSPRSSAAGGGGGGGSNSGGGAAGATAGGVGGQHGGRLEGLAGSFARDASSGGVFGSGREGLLASARESLLGSPTLLARSGRAETATMTVAAAAAAASVGLLNAQ